MPRSLASENKIIKSALYATLNFVYFGLNESVFYIACAELEAPDYFHER